MTERYIERKRDIESVRETLRERKRERQEASTRDRVIETQ